MTELERMSMELDKKYGKRTVLAAMWLTRLKSCLAGLELDLSTEERKSIVERSYVALGCLLEKLMPDDSEVLKLAECVARLDSYVDLILADSLEGEGHLPPMPPLKK